MLDLFFFLILRLHNACSPLVINLQLINRSGLRISHSKVPSSDQNICLEKYKSLGPMSFHEKSVLSLFSTLVLIWFTRYIKRYWRRLSDKSVFILASPDFFHKILDFSGFFPLFNFCFSFLVFNFFGYSFSASVYFLNSPFSFLLF